MKSKTVLSEKELELMLSGLKKEVAVKDTLFNNAARVKEILGTTRKGKKQNDVLVEEFDKEMRKLKRLLHRDPLTGVSNGLGLAEKYGPLFNQALYKKEKIDRRRNVVIKDLSIVYFDLTNLDDIRNECGEDAAVTVLKDVAKLMKARVRKIDGIGRLAGGEFVVVLVGADEKKAVEKAEVIIKAIGQKVRVTKKIKLLSTAGASSVNQSRAKTLKQLVGFAERAMRKTKGKNNGKTILAYSQLRIK